MLELRSSPVDVQMFSSLLRYLYTGDLCPHDPTIDVNVLRRLGEDFGTPNPLEHDLRYLLETGDYADAALVFTSESSTSSHSNNNNSSNTTSVIGSSGVGGNVASTSECRPDSGSSEYGFRPKLELPCHKAILSARSPFFRGMIQRRLRSFEEQNDRAIPTRIVLDETVIPKRYARVLLHAIYLDTVDLSLIIRNGNNNNNGGSSPLEEAMELYQIGRFLELDILSQGCEDLILEWLTLESLPMVLKWGSQAHGSSWVYRQACHYLREEFSAIAVSPILHQLEKSQLIDALQSNFLQASELEILSAVLRWGEQELIRRMEDREPNLLSHTAHSVTRKGIKKRDLSDIELREILSELLPHVRMDHVLPPNNETLHSAIRRGLVSTPPSHMIERGDDRENLRINAWIRGGKNHGLFVRPRLFMPYFDEIKSLLEDHNASQQIEIQRLRRSRHYPDIPDTLYMVSRLNRCSVSNVNNSNNDLLSVSPSMAAAQQLDIVNQTSTSSIPAPDPSSMQSMQKREQKLRQTPMCQRAMALTLSSKHEIYRQIRLRVVREFNFPDEVSILLENSMSCFCNDGDKVMGGGGSGGGDDSAADDEIITGPSSPMASNENIPEALALNNLTFPRVQQSHPNSSTSSAAYHHLPSLVADDDDTYTDDIVHADMPHMSMIMPDVTASLGQMQINQMGGPSSENIESLHLDLGDGSNHIISTQPRQSTASIGSSVAVAAAAQSQMHLYGTHYHHYMTRYMAQGPGSSSSSSSNQQATSSQQQQQQQPSSSHHVPSNSSPYAGIITSSNRRGGGSSSSGGGGEGSSSFRSTSSHSHSSSFL